jgi:F-type H+/Na+-transporting ATPase subunit alpha
MVAAEQAVRQAAADIPDEVNERFDSGARLSDADREVIVEIGRTALEDFLSEAAPGPRRNTRRRRDTTDQTPGESHAEQP